MTQSPAPIPGWARQRVSELAMKEGWPSPTSDAFARYIAAHEQEPVDPLCDEAQTIADVHGVNLSASPRTEKALLHAIRRGIELGRANK